MTALTCALASVALLPDHAAAAATETATDVEGRLEILVEDHPASARLRHVLVRGDERVELVFGSTVPAHLKSGMRLRAKGRRDGSTLALASGDTAALTVTAAATGAPTTGEFQTLVLLVNFTDDRSQPFDTATARSVVFDQVGGFLRENSHGKTWLGGGVHPDWLELPIAKTCDVSAITASATQAAAARGVDVRIYDRVIHAFPQNSVCGWGGMANLGGPSPGIWLNGWMTLQVVAHEFGHTLGLYHAHSLDCGTATIAATGCTTWEYGDKYGVMGNQKAGHIDSFGKERLGWLNAPSQPDIATAQGSGRYTIEAYAASPGGVPKALKVPRGVDPATGAMRWYYLEYRQPVGYDITFDLGAGSNLVRGIVMRTGTDANGNSSWLLDATPASSSWDDWPDAAIGFGQAYVDAAAGVQIVPIAGDGQHAQIDVTVGSAACTRAAPSVVIQNSGSTTATAGSVLGYQVSVDNNDTAACPAANLDLAATVPAGWSSALGATRLSLASGGRANVAWTVTSSAAAVVGTQSLSLRATHVESTLAATSAATYTVASTAPATSAALATDKPNYRRGDTVGAAVVVTQGTSPAAAASVVFTFRKPGAATVQRSATTDAAGTARATYKLARRDPVGAWTVQTSVTIGTASATATSAFTVE